MWWFDTYAGDEVGDYIGYLICRQPVILLSEPADLVRRAVIQRRLKPGEHVLELILDCFFALYSNTKEKFGE